MCKCTCLQQLRTRAKHAREVLNEYQGLQDDPSFDALIKRGFVLDKSGQVEIVMTTYTSLNDVTYVKSGRGFYDV